MELASCRTCGAGACAQAYATAVAESYADAARRALYGGTMFLLAPVGVQSATLVDSGVRNPALIARLADSIRGCRCIWDLAPRFVFRLNARSRAISLPDARGVDSALIAWVSDTVSRHIAAAVSREATRPRFTPVYAVIGGIPRLLVFTTRQDAMHAPLAAYGFVTDFASFERAALHELDPGRLLPPWLAQDSTSSPLTYALGMRAIACSTPTGERLPRPR